MTSEKRKVQLRKAQAKHRANKTKEGWRWLQVPPEIFEEVKFKIKEYLKVKKNG